MKTRDLIPLIMLGIGLFLLTIIGGQIRLDSGFAMQRPAFRGIFDGNWPMGSQAILATLLIIPLIISIATRKVQHVPSWHLWAPLSLFLTMFILSASWSEFPQASQDMVIQWCIYGATFFSVVAVVGRKQGIQIAAGFIIVGATAVSTRGILEYSSMKVIDPTWRIFGGWVGPNALAGLLIITLILSFGMLGHPERLVKLLVGASAVLQGLAILLTQSKGALLALVVGLFVYFVMLAVRKQGKMIAATGGLMVLIVLLGIGVQASSKTGTGAMNRVAASSSTSEQSEGFRSLLWLGALTTIKSDPIGTGIGTYKFESARSGFHTQTALAHQTFLQVAFEGGVISFLLLLVFIIMWCIITLRGYRNLPPERAQIYAGIFASLTASAAHSFVDSDWYYMGIGILIFALMGLGVQCAQDSSSPEFTRRHNLNWLGFGACGLLVFASWIPAYRDSLIMKANQFRMDGDSNRSLETWTQISQLFPNEPASYRALAQQNGSMRQALERAVAVNPSTSNLRLLATERAKNREGLSSADHSIAQALQRDPNNLPALKIRIEIQLQQDNIEAARRTMNRIREIEKLPYFTIRALPEHIPTDSFEARLLLAGASDSPAERDQLNLEAARGLIKYLEITALKSLEYKDIPGGFAGETIEDAIEKATLAQKVGEYLLQHSASSESRTIGEKTIKVATEFLAKASKSSQR